MGRRRGRARKEGRQGGVVTRARLSRVCPARLMEEGGSYQRSCKLRVGSCLHPYKVATIVTLASYDSSQHCAGVVTCFCLLWE